MTVRIGFVGAGSRSVYEMTQLLQLPDVAITGICDIAPEAVELARIRVKEHGPAGLPPLDARGFTDVKAMLEQVPLDAVYVSLPPFAHGQAEHAVIEAGKALMVEKPVALTMAVAREIAAHVREKDVLTAVAYQWRYSTAVQKIRQLLDGVSIGMVTAVRWSYLPESPWWRVQSKSGGMLIEQHTHCSDLLRYLCGEVTEVYAMAATALLQDVPDLDIADVNAVTLRLASGAVGTISNSCAAVAALPGFHSYVHIIAQGMTVAVGLGPGATILRGREAREDIPEEGDPNIAMNRAFVEAVRSGDRSGILCPYEEGVRTFELTYAAHISATERRLVRIGEALP
ncbi:MAG: Gfo/Idh/MocA family oxidoreductase [Chloroflexi bacterium]|nr:Gfo/Idh/MocA family oxidoreductase [Chloroflexota bacterium]